MAIPTRFRRPGRLHQVFGVPGNGGEHWTTTVGGFGLCGRLPDATDYSGKSKKSSAGTQVGGARVCQFLFFLLTVGVGGASRVRSPGRCY